MITRVIFTGVDHDPTWVFDKISEEPELHKGQMLLRIRLATICGSDMHTILGKISLHCNLHVACIVYNVYTVSSWFTYY